jgi:hypothetical protein
MSDYRDYNCGECNYGDCGKDDEGSYEHDNFDDGDNSDGDGLRSRWAKHFLFSTNPIVYHFNGAMWQCR